VGEVALTERAVLQLVREYVQQIGIGELEQIQFLLGHESDLDDGKVLGLRTGSEECGQRRGGV
jgi:hypothetical protein